MQPHHHHRAAIVIQNHSDNDVLVWNQTKGRFWIRALTSSDVWGEAIGYIRNRWGTWFKLGVRSFSAVVDPNGEIHGYKRKATSRELESFLLTDPRGPY